MKPTQQEIIELAREAGIEWQRNTTITGKVRITTCGSQPVDKLERFAELLLERFGAGGGEPSRDMPHGWVTNWPAPNGGTSPVYHASAIKPKYGPELDNSLVSYPVFTRPGPSPSDLRAEYLRGLEDAAKVCEYVATLYSEAARKHPEDSESRIRTFARSRAASQCVEEIRALLKGKQ